MYKNKSQNSKTVSIIISNNIYYPPHHTPSHVKKIYFINSFILYYIHLSINSYTFLLLLLLIIMNLNIITILINLFYNIYL